MDHCYLQTQIHPHHSLSKIKFMSLNVCGLASKLKYGVFEETIKDCDFVCLNEIKTNFIAPDEFENFHVFVSQKVNKKGKTSGIAILASKENSKHFEVLNTSSNWVLWLLVGDNPSKPDFILGAVYIPCAISAHSSETIFDEIFLDIVKIKSVHDLPLILMGDFNSRTGVLDDFVHFDDLETVDCDDFQVDFTHNLEKFNLCRRHNLDKKTNVNSNGLINLCKNFNLNIVNGRFGDDKGVGDYTCYKSDVGISVIDYAIISDCLIPQVSNFSIGIFDKALSDVHCPLFLELISNDVNVECENTSENANTVTLQNNQNFVHKWRNGANLEYKNSFSSEEIENIENLLTNFTDCNEISQENMDNIACEINHLFIDTAKNIGLCKPPKKQVKKYSRIFPNKPWWNNNCEARRREYLDLKYHKPGKKWKKERDFTFKEYKHFLDGVQYNYKKETEVKLRNAKDTKDYFRIINSATSSGNNKKCNISMDQLFDHFKKLSFKEQEANSFDPRNVVDKDSISEELNCDFIYEEVMENIKKLKNNKSSGLDQILNEYLKNSPKSVILIIVKLFNIVFRTGVVPSDWCNGFINPIFKNKGSSKCADNYRGITLLSCLGKLFTSTLNLRLTNFSIKRGIIGEEQAGFRPGYGTNDHIYVLDALIQLYKARYEQLYCAFIDYKKAFDLINRSFLWMKLVSNEVNGKFLNVIFNLYEHAKSCVKKGNDISEFFLCNIGVRQGENLSPLLFSFFLNDFARHIGSKYNGLSNVSRLCSNLLSDEDVEVFVRLFVLLYADDTIVLAESEQELQDALVGVYEYCDQWQLKVNVDKTKVVIFSRGKIRKHRNFFFGALPLEVVEEYNYLGMICNYDGTYNKAIQKRIQQATKAMYSLLTKARRLCLPVDIVCDIFEKTVIPVLTYACEIWGSGDLTPVEIFYKKFLKIVLQLNRCTPSVIVYGEVGKLPLRNTIYKRMLGYWIKLSEDKNTKYSSVIYNLLFKLHNSGAYHFKWFEKIKQLLDSCNFGHLWLDQTENKGQFKRNIFAALDNLEQQKWLNEVNTSNFCHTYRIFKQELNLEQYLIKLPFQHRINLTKFRCKNNKLPINKFRFDNTNVDKSCQICSSNDIGDEFHYLFDCDFFKSERKMFLLEYFYKRPNTLKMGELFNSKNLKTQIYLSKFVKIIVETFK